MNSWKEALRAAFPHTIPVLAGYLFLGVAYGFLMHERGLGLGITFLSSLLIYGGSLQYVQLDVVTKAFAPLSTWLLSLVISIRHVAYGITMSDRFQAMGKAKWLLAFGMTDETVSLECSLNPPSGIDAKKFYLCISELDHLYWITASCLGHVLGGLVRFDTTGMDFVLTALFVTIFVDQWRSVKDHRSAILGIAVPCLSLWLVPEQFILVSLISLIGLLLLFRKQLEGVTDAGA